MAEIAPARAGSSGKHFGHVEKLRKYEQQKVVLKNTARKAKKKKHAALVVDGKTAPK